MKRAREQRRKGRNQPDGRMQMQLKKVWQKEMDQQVRRKYGEKSVGKRLVASKSGKQQ